MSNSQNTNASSDPDGYQSFDKAIEVTPLPITSATPLRSHCYSVDLALQWSIGMFRKLGITSVFYI